MGGQTPREPHGAGRASPRPARGRARAAWAVSADSAGTTVLRPARRTDGNVRPTPAESWDMWGTSGSEAGVGGQTRTRRASEAPSTRLRDDPRFLRRRVGLRKNPDAGEHPTPHLNAAQLWAPGGGGARILTPRHPPTINGSPPARRVRLPRQPRAACDGGSFPSHRAMAAEARRPPRGGTKSGSSLLSRPKTTRTAPPASVDKRGPGFPVSRITFSLTSHICGGFQGSLLPVAHSTQEPALLTSRAVAAPSPPQARGFANVCEGTAPATRVALSSARWTRVSRT